MDCIFCKIVKGEIPCYKVFETENVMAFLDVMPVAAGHILVIPKEHVKYFYDAEPKLMGEVMQVATKLTAALVKISGATGVNLIINAGAIAGQVVGHTHLHLIPRFEGDKIEFNWPQGQLDQSQAQLFLAAIAKEL